MPQAATTSENGQSGVYNTALGHERRAIWNPCIYFTSTKLWPPAKITELATAAITAQVLKDRKTKAR